MVDAGGSRRVELVQGRGVSGEDEIRDPGSGRIGQAGLGGFKARVRRIRDKKGIEWWQV